ncbi:MAG: flagellar motor switch protein FliN [Mycobacteriales bacterium]
MTVLSTRDSVRDAVTAVAAAAARTLPLSAVADAPLSDATVADLLPPDGKGRAVSLNVRGAAVGRLVLVVADSLSSALENSPFGAQELLAALGPALADAGTALEQFSSESLQIEAAHEVEPGIALAGLGDGRLFAAVLLRTGGEHVATIALLVEQELAPEASEIPEPRENATTHTFQPLDQTRPASRAARPMDLLHNVEMGVTAELGRTRMTVRDLLALTPGAVVELDRAAGSPVDVLVNGTLIARGEVVVIDEEFAIRISEIIGTRTLDAVRR